MGAMDDLVGGKNGGVLHQESSFRARNKPLQLCITLRRDRGSGGVIDRMLIH